MAGARPPRNLPSAAPNPAVNAPGAVSRHVRLVRDLRPGERLVILRRRHPAVLFGGLVAPLGLFALWLVSLVFVLPFISSLGASQDSASVLEGGLPTWLPTLVWLAWLGLAVLLVLWAAYRVLDWTDDWMALTNRRVILMDKRLFFRETRREAPIERVQNVVAEYPNSVGVALDYGDVRVDTAGIGVLEFRHLPHPRQMREAIFEQQEALRSARPSAEESRRAAVRSILHGRDPLAHDRPTPPNGNPVMASRDAQPAVVPARGVLDDLFPFAPRREGDTITWHKHWAVLLRGLFLPVTMWLAAILAWFGAMLLGGEGQVGGMAVVAGWAAVGLAPVCLLWVLWKWDDWRNDTYMLDHERVYDIDRLPLGLREQSKETLVTRVTDVIYTVPGPLAHLLDYGDVELKTPGEATRFVFESVPRPREVQREIMDRLEDYRSRTAAGTDREIQSWLRAYEDVRRESAGL